MHKSYRTFTLQALRTGPLNIAETIAEHKDLLEESKQTIKKSIYRLILVWSVSLSVFAGVVVGLLFNHLIAGIILFVLLSLAAVFATKIPYVNEKLSNSIRYKEQFRQIKQSNAAIEELHQKARAYQQHLEIDRGPGLLACFADVLLNDYYPSFFPLEDRIRFVELSTKGQGRNIDIFDYGRLILELKACDFDDYIDTESLVAKVPPQNKYNAAIAYGELIAKGTSKATEDSIRFAAIVGLNAWYAYEQQGQPLTWNNYETERWSIIHKIFKEAIARNTLGLAKAISQFNQNEKRQI